MGAIRSTCDGPEGLVQLAAAGTVLVECSTGDPALSRELATRARGVEYLDAPMLRTAAAARNGTQQVIVRGEREALARASAVLESFTERILHVGPVGSGHALKLINNTVTICNTAVLCETFVVARSNGVDVVKKYLSLYGQLAADADVTTPIGDTVHNLVRQAANQGFGTEHYTRVASVLEGTRPFVLG